MIRNYSNVIVYESIKQDAVTHEYKIRSLSLAFSEVKIFSKMKERLIKRKPLIGNVSY